MSQLKSHEKKIFEKLFDRGGYVLDFSDSTYAEFFRENGININDNKYFFNGTSKMKRLRAFWEIEPDQIVGKLLEALLEYACAIENVNEKDKKKALEAICRLQGKIPENKLLTEEYFLKQNFEEIDWKKLDLESQLQSILQQRIEEIQKTLRAKAPLSVIFLCGSILEGLLLDIASKHPKLFNESTSAPKNNGKVMAFPKWNLQSFIDVAYEIGLLSLDIKKYILSLRDFRNYIHPRQQIISNFFPDTHTAKSVGKYYKQQLHKNQESKPIGRINRLRCIRTQRSRPFSHRWHTGKQSIQPPQNTQQSQPNHKQCVSPIP